MKQHGNVEELDRPTRGWRWRHWVKKAKHRFERRKAKLDPNCAAAYNRFAGWIS